MLFYPPLEKLVPPHIRQFEPYIPSKPDGELCKLYGCSQIFRMNNNENPLGPPEGARRALENFDPASASIYPSGDAWYLRHALGKHFSLPPECFIVGNGANEVISFVISAFCEKGDNIITADRTFAVYEWVASFSGFQAKVLPLLEETFDDQAMLRGIDERTKVLFLCNPNNPTGTYWNQSKLISFLETLGGRQILVVDESYGEFVEREDFPDALELLPRYPNLVVFRTFSKMYGLAGLRIGYLAGDPGVVDMIRRASVVYSVNAPAQLAAEAALKDTEHIRATREICATAREILGSAASRLNLPCSLGEGNFGILKLPCSDTWLYRNLMKRGYMIRSLTGFRMPGHIRISFHMPEVMQGFVMALEEILSTLSS
jgi:histidinol-phosphate aminotransferase